MFNPNARWDRVLPQDETQPGEPLEVEASFCRGRFYPVWFIFAGRKHSVKKIQFVWKEKKGKDTFYLFSVTDENNQVHKICFNRQGLSWTLLLDD